MRLTERAKALILMLASDIDGEALNAARALGRHLKSSGMDFHDLAKAASQEPRVIREPCRACADREAERQRRASGAHAAKVKWILTSGYSPTEREREFLESILEWEGELTEKQAAWFGKIYAKATRAEAEF